MLSGRRLDLLDPSPLDIEIADIAHGLARVARWNGQTSGAHIFSVAQHTLLVEAVLRQQKPRIDAQLPARGDAARCAGIRHRRHDLAVQGGARRRLQGGGEAAAGGDPYPLRTAAGAGGQHHAGDQGRRPGRGLSRGDRACRLRGSRSQAPVRPGSRPAAGDAAGISDAVDRGQGREAVSGAVQAAAVAQAEHRMPEPAFRPLPTLRAYNRHDTEGPP